MDPDQNHHMSSTEDHSEHSSAEESETNEVGRESAVGRRRAHTNQDHRSKRNKSWKSEAGVESQIGHKRARTTQDPGGNREESLKSDIDELWKPPSDDSLDEGEWLEDLLANDSGLSSELKPTKPIAYLLNQQRIYTTSSRELEVGPESQMGHGRARSSPEWTPRLCSAPVGESTKLVLPENEYVIVQNSEGQEIIKIPKFMATCEYCYLEFQEDMIQMHCNCDFSMIHKSCKPEWSQKGGNKCNGCEQDIQYIDVTVSTAPLPTAPQHLNGTIRTASTAPLRAAPLTLNQEPKGSSTFQRLFGNCFGL